MSNPEHLAAFLSGMRGWKRWRETSGVVRPDLSGADLSTRGLRNTNLVRERSESVADAKISSRGNVVDLSGVDLSATDLRNTNLSGADLSQANLSGAQLGFAVLEGTTLDAANLTHANLYLTQLTRISAVTTDFRYAELNFTVFNGADLRGARFADATVGGCVFANADMSSARGLEHVLHVRPSSVGIDTLQRSRGLVSNAFLRGAGLSANVIDLAHTLWTQHRQFPSCFISYSTDDQAFAKRLYHDLHHHGIQTWFAPHDMRSGRKMHEQIGEAISVHDRLLLILSKSSMVSPWVKTEIAHAREKEQLQSRRVLFPIGLVPFEQIRHWTQFNADIGEDTAREIREYFIPDFSRWEEDEHYRAAFDKLRRDLATSIASGASGAQREGL